MTGMNNKFFTLFIFYLLFSLASKAQVDSVKRVDRYYRHNYENDFFVSETIIVSLPSQDQLLVEAQNAVDAVLAP